MNNNLKNLENIGHLKFEPFDNQEYSGLIQSGKARLKDASNQTLSHESRFDLAYNAAHAFALAALRKYNYRSTNRYIVFQALSHTIKLEPENIRILDTCHNKRNIAEYEGYFEINETLLNELIKTTQLLLNKLEK